MEYDEREVIEETIYKYHSDLLSSRERELGLAFLAKAKAEARQKPHVEERMRERMGNLGDREIDAVVRDGFLAFRRTVVDRILRDHASEIVFNRCPACHRIVRTPWTKQCMWCTHEWR